MSPTRATGVSYPSTEGPDDDPIDAAIWWDVATYPGVVIPCRALSTLNPHHDAQTLANFVASHFANAAFTCDGAFLRHPVARLDHHLRQVRTVFTHRFGKPGARRVADQIVGRMKEKHRHARAGRR